MKKQSQFANKICFLIILITILTGCLDNECNCYDDFTPLPLSEKYFSNYKDENQSWVFVNQDGTKRDSVFLTPDLYDNGNNGADYSTNLCYIFYSWNMILHSKYLLNDTILSQYSSAGVKKKEVGILWWNTIFILETRHIRKINWGSVCEYGVDTMQLSTKAKISPYRPKTLKLTNDVIYNDVITIDNTLWFAPNVGLIQFVSYNKVDTFHLQKFYKK